MAKPLYSSQLVVSHAGGIGEYTAPAGFTAVIRYITVFNSYVLGNASAAIVHQLSDATIYQRTIGPQEWFADLAHFVLNELETLDLNVDATVDLSLSGYLLSLL